MRVLVTHGSSHGSTRSIAERIADRLRAAGTDVECVPLDEIPSPEGFDAVVIGSAIHDRAWLPEAAQFVVTNEAVLASRPVWLFSVGMPAAVARPFRNAARTEGPIVIDKLGVDVHPKGTRLFSGVVTRDQLPPASRLIMKLTGTKFGDFRDWPAIDAWADAIAAELTRMANAPTS